MRLLVALCLAASFYAEDKTKFRTPSRVNSSMSITWNVDFRCGWTAMTARMLAL